MADLIPLRIRAAAESTPVPDDPLTVDARRLAALLGVGLRTVRTWDAAGRLPAPVRIGGRVLWIVDDGDTGIRAWLRAGAPDRETWAAMCAARR